MLKKKQISSRCLVRENEKHSRCIFCYPKNKNFQLVTMVDNSLIKKYSKLISDSTATSELNHFVSGLSVIYPGGLGQFLIQHSVKKQYLIEFFTINVIKLRITQVIKKNYKNTKYPTIHFHLPIYRIMLRGIYFKRSIKQPSIKKQVRVTTPILNKLLVSNFEKKYKKSDEKKNIFKVKSVDQSYCELRNLCKKINTMCNRFDENIVRKFKSNLDFISKKSKEKNIDRKFKERVEENVSMIKANKPKSKDKIKITEYKCQNVQQLYGIQQWSTKNKTKIDETRPYEKQRASTQKGQIIKDSPITQAYYTKQYNYTQTGQKITIKRKSKYTPFTSLSIKKKRSSLISLKDQKSKSSGKKNAAQLKNIKTTKNK